MADKIRRSSDRQGTDGTTGRRAKPALGPAGLAVLGLAVVLGVALLVLSVPRTVAAWSSLEAQPAMGKLWHGEDPTPEELSACIEASQRALRWTESAERWGNLGSCEYARARQTSVDSPERANWLALAEKHTQESVIANPADGHGWYRLALIRQARGAAAREIVPPLIASLDVAPNARRMWRGRGEMLLFYAPMMKAEELTSTAQQLRTMWTYSPAHRPALLGQARRLGRRGVLIAALLSEPEALAELDMMERQSRFP
jgi:hypothetical protein